MGRGKRTVRASEIGSFIYCQRAWWYQRRGFTPLNRKEMAAGSHFHDTHVSRSRTYLVLRFTAWILFFTGLTYLVIILITGQRY